MPLTTIKDGEIQTWYDEGVPNHFSLILSNADRRIQTVVLLKPDEVDRLAGAIIEYSEMLASRMKREIQ